MTRSGWIAVGALVLGVLVALAILLDLGPFADEALSEAEFVAQADEICAQAHADYEDAQGSPPRTANEAAGLTQKLIDVSDEELDRVSDLSAPASLQPQVDRVP